MNALSRKNQVKAIQKKTVLSLKANILSEMLLAFVVFVVVVVAVAVAVVGVGGGCTLFEAVASWGGVLSSSTFKCYMLLF